MRCPHARHPCGSEPSRSGRSVTAPAAGEHLFLLLDSIGRDDQRDRTSNGLVRRVPEHPGRARIPGGDDAVERLADDRVIRPLDDGGEVSLDLFRPSTIRDVDAGADVPGEAAVRLESRHTAVKDPAVLAVVPAETVLHLEWALTGKGRAVCFETPSKIVGMETGRPALAELRGQRSAGKVEPRLIEERVPAVRPGQPHQDRRRIGEDPKLGESLAPGGRVVENEDDAARHVAGHVDGRRAIFNGDLAPLPAEENGVVRQPDDDPLGQDSRDRIFGRLPCVFIDNPKDGGDILPTASASGHPVSATAAGFRNVTRPSLSVR